jgi:CheY-like chemotaxis protein
VELPLSGRPGCLGIERRSEGGRAGTIQVLMVEDNPDTRALLAESLEMMGYSVRAAPSAEEGLELLRNGSPDVILADIGLPGMNGYAFLECARRMPGVQTVPAFAISGFGQAEDVRRAQEAGFLEHFVKPVDVATLDTRIRERLRTRAAA